MEIHAMSAKAHRFLFKAYGAKLTFYTSCFLVWGETNERWRYHQWTKVFYLWQQQIEGTGHVFSSISEATGEKSAVARAE